MTNALAFVGGIFILCVVLGAAVPGAAFHVYLGSDAGAKKWHAKHSAAEVEQ